MRRWHAKCPFVKPAFFLRGINRCLHAVLCSALDRIEHFYDRKINLKFFSYNYISSQFKFEFSIASPLFLVLSMTKEMFNLTDKNEVISNEEGPVLISQQCLFYENSLKDVWSMYLCMKKHIQSLLAIFLISSLLSECDLFVLIISLINLNPMSSSVTSKSVLRDSVAFISGSHGNFYFNQALLPSKIDSSRLKNCHGSFTIYGLRRSRQVRTSGSGTAVKKNLSNHPKQNWLLIKHDLATLSVFLGLIFEGGPSTHGTNQLVRMERKGGKSH